MVQPLKQTVTALLLLSILFFGATAIPHEAEAGIVGSFSGCAGGALLSIGISAALSYFGLTVPTADISQIIKEKVEDCIAWSIANASLEGVTFQVTNYVNTGLDGNPAYVTDITKKLQETADDTVKTLYQRRELDSLPEAFRNEVALANLEDYNRKSNFQDSLVSSLDETTYDIDAFLREGDFSQGGLDTWDVIILEPQSNPIGAYFLTRLETSRRIAGQTQQEEREIERGGGLFDKEECEDIEIGTTLVGGVETPITEEQCEVVTPGSVIHSSLTKVFGSSVDRIVQVDELNEALSTLFVGLINEILSDDEGLRGSGDFISENSDFAEEFGTPVGPGGGTEGLPTGGCPVDPNASLSQADEGAAVDHYSYLNNQRSGQIVFNGGDTYTATIVINDVRYDYEGPSIADAVSQMCVAQNAPCPGTGTLSEEEKSGILKVDAWAGNASRNLAAIRKRTWGSGYYIDFYDSVAKVVGQFGPGEIGQVAQEFCDAAELGNEE